MFKSLDNNSSIPNNYVYTSNKGTEYMYLDGSWLNCETMSTVDSTHNFKMNQSAIRQIAEHNQSSTLQIGKKYIINESEYVYVGRNNFTFNGNMLTESINKRVIKLIESESKFSDFIKGDTSNIEIPNRFQLDRNTVYLKNKNKWFSDGKVIEDSQYNKELNADAVKKIQQYNERESELPVNSTIKYDGNTYTWTGIGWVGDDNKVRGDKFSELVYDYLDENPQDTNTKSTTNDSVTEPNLDSNGEVKKGAKFTDKNGRSYVYNGSEFVSNDESQTPHPNSAQLVQKYKKAAQNQASEQSTGTDGTDGSNDPRSSGAANSGAGEPSNSSTEIPNGYVYTSGKNKSYYKKNGQWFSADTKEPINSSSAVPLERAAKAAIDKHNATAAVKIGDTFKSKKGITYKYVGGTRFISDNGKLLPKDTAQTVLNNLWKQADERKAQDQQSNQDEQPVQDTAQNDQQGSSAPAPQPESDPSQNDNISQGNEPLKELAEQIKSNPEARRIIVLLSRGDDLSLLAADILLSGQQKEVAQILNSLNNEE